MANLYEWNYCIWGCQEFSAILTNEEGSPFKNAATYICDLLITIKKKFKIPVNKTNKTKEKNPYQTRAWGDCKKLHRDLMDIVDINL